MVAWGELLSGLVGSLIGGGLAVLGAVWGVHLQHEAQARLADKAERAEVAGYLGALHAELSVLWGSFQARVHPLLNALPDGQVFDFQWPSRQAYFTVYDSNAHLLGRVPSAELRALIVSTYTATKGMLESVGYNGEANLRLADMKARVSPTAQSDAQMAESTAALVALARGLKASELELAGLVERLLPQLQPSTSGSRA